MNQYKISTLKDIYDTVPEEKIHECMAELAQLMIQRKGIESSAKNAATFIGAQIDAGGWPDSVTWVDDGKGEIITRVVDNEGNCYLSVEETVK
jgi:hypothetical protein